MIFLYDFAFSSFLSFEFPEYQLIIFVRNKFHTSLVHTWFNVLFITEQRM